MNIGSPFGKVFGLKSFLKMSSALILAYSPLVLFANGEQGVWFEPSTTTAFASTTDLTPCAVGDTCGFLLDKSQGAGYSGGSFTGLGSEEAPALNTYAIVGTGTWSSISGGYEFEDTVGGQVRPGVAWGSRSVTEGNGYYVEVEILSITGASQVRIDRNGDVGDVLAGTGTTTFFTVADVTMASQGLRFRLEDVSTTIGDGFALASVTVKELPGNHATQVTEPSRPILARVPVGGRQNLLEYTEDFTNPYWTIQGTSIALDTAVPEGGSIFEVTETAGGSVHQFFGESYPLDEVETVVLHAEIKAGSGGRYAGLKLFTQPGGVSGRYGFIVDLTDGSITDTNTSGATLTGVTTNVTDVGDGFYRISVGCTNAETIFGHTMFLSDSATPTWNAFTVPEYSGSGTNTYFFRKLQMEINSTPTAYQKVVNEYDVTEAGVTSLHYLSFDGTDDAMETAAVDFSASDEMSVFGGFTRVNNTGTELLVELSADANTNSGAFFVAAPDQPNSNYAFRARGDAAAAENQTARDNGTTTPETVVLTGLSDISADTNTLRIDGTQVSQSSGELGAGNFGNYPMYLGSRGGTPFYFEGDLYSLIIRGAATSGTDLTDAENYVAGKTGVTL